MKVIYALLILVGFIFAQELKVIKPMVSKTQSYGFDGLRYIYQDPLFGLVIGDVNSDGQLIIYADSSVIGQLHVDSLYANEIINSGQISRVDLDSLIVSIGGDSLVEIDTLKNWYGVGRSLTSSSVMKQEVHTPVYEKNLYDNSRVVAKKGIVIFRDDDYTDSTPKNILSPLTQYISVLDKYHIKSVVAFNAQHETSTYWADPDYVRVWRWLQNNGHELAWHSPSHTQGYYLVPPAFRQVSGTTPGVLRIGSSATIDTVWMDTSSVDGAVNYVSWKGHDLLLKRQKQMLNWLGLNDFTYQIQSGGTQYYLTPDSIFFAAQRNGILGGAYYYTVIPNYKHQGYNPPAVFGKLSAYHMNFITQNDMTLTTTSYMDGDRVMSAQKAFIKLTNVTARNAVSHISHHVRKENAPQWWLAEIDSICNFLVKNAEYMNVMTGTEAARTLYYSQTNPYENVFPTNPYTNQVFEDDIDGDGVPDGWSFGQYNLPTSWYSEFNLGSGGNDWALEGSQGSARSASVTIDDTLFMYKLYGIEKGTNLFYFDAKDSSGYDATSVKVWIGMYNVDPDDKYTVTRTDSVWTFTPTSSWQTFEKEVTFDRNCAYIEMWVWSTDNKALVDEFMLRKK